MFSPLTLIASMFVYIGLLFFIARLAEHSGQGRRFANHPVTYALGLTVYCTTWTYYGSVGKAATGGMGYLPVYLGPTLALLIGGSVFRRIAALKHAHRITSIADFISARFAKSRAVAAVVTAILTVGIIPYIALQMKAANQTFSMLVEGGSGEHSILAESFGPVSVCLMIVFTIVFGIRHLDPTERHPGMLASVATEAFVKLVAFVAAGAFVFGVAFGGYPGFEDALARLQPGALPLMGQSSANDTLTYVTVMLLSMAAFAFLPRQFHVGIVENHRPEHVKTAQWVTPLYLVLINLFVLPIALGGQLLAKSGTSADFYVLALPLQAGQSGLSLAVFLGGFSAAIGMVMIESLTMATMISNHLLLPVIQRVDALLFLRRHLLFMRWAAAAFFILAGYLFAVKIGKSYPLVAIGLISFAAAFVLAPVVLLGLYWRGANRAGALLGAGAGGLVWFYTLMVPTFVKAGWIDKLLLEQGLLGCAVLRPEALFGWTGLPTLAHGVMWSSLASLIGLIGGSTLFTTSEKERLMAEAFLGDPGQQLGHLDATHAKISVSEQLAAVRERLSPYFAIGETERLLEHAVSSVGIGEQQLISEAQNAALLCALERCLAGALGAASAHAVLGELHSFERKDAASLQQEFTRTLAALNLSPRELQQHLADQRDRARELEGAVESREHEIVVRTRELQTLLDNISCGLLAIDAELTVQAGYSHSCHQLLDCDSLVDRRLTDILRLGPRLREQWERATQSIFESALPEQELLGLLPRQVRSVGGRELRMGARLVRDDAGAPRLLLLTISDATELEQTRRAAELSSALVAILRRRPAFEDFLEQAREQLRLARKRAGTDAGLVRRVVHGIKTNAALFGLVAIADQIQEIEDQPQIELSDLDAIAAALRGFVDAQAAMLGLSFETRSAQTFQLSQGQLEQLRALLSDSRSGSKDAADQLLGELGLVPAEELLGPVEELVAALSERSGKKVAFELRGADVRADRALLSPLFQLVPQLLRNAVDHGIEAPGSRGSKPDVGRVSLEVLDTDATYVLAVQDDGRGIDRSAVLRAAVARSVVSEAGARMISEADMLRLVLRERVSTATTVTDVSGRGYGLAYVQAEAKRLGGDVIIKTRLGRGTRFEIVVPKVTRPTRPSHGPARLSAVPRKAWSQR